MNAVEKCNVLKFFEEESTKDYTTLPLNLTDGIDLNLVEDIEDSLPKSKGCDCPSRDEIEEVIEHLLANGKIKQACLLTVHIHFGLRNSDVGSLRVFELIKADGTFRDTVQKQEKKTGKFNNLVINETVRIAVATYLKTCKDKKYTDYLFTSDSNHKKLVKATIQLSDGKVHEYETFAPLSRMSEERYIKNSFIECGYNLSNDKRCSGEGSKYSTHSLRKYYCLDFTNTATRLKAEGKIMADMQILEMVSLSLNHASTKTTLVYSRKFKEEEKIIVSHMDTGKKQWLNYLKSQA